MRLPPEAYEWVERAAERWIEWLAQSGVDVVGDLDDLRPVCARPTTTAVARTPTGCRPRKRLKVAVDALAAMTEEAAARPDPDQQLVRRIGAARRAAAEPVNADTAADQGERRAWGWVHHLRDGGTTPWADVGGAG